MVTGKCARCGNEFTHKKHKGLNAKIYCHQNCQPRYVKLREQHQQRPDYLGPLYSASQNWEILGYDLAYLIDIDDELTDDEKQQFGISCEIYKDLSALRQYNKREFFKQTKEQNK